MLKHHPRLDPGEFCADAKVDSNLGLQHTGAFIGSVGGAKTAGPGASNTVISNIVICVWVNATSYAFGETGQGLVGQRLCRQQQQRRAPCCRAGHFPFGRHKLRRMSPAGLMSARVFCDQKPGPCTRTAPVRL